MDVEAPSNAPAGSTGGAPLRRTLSRPDDKKKNNILCKGICFISCYFWAYCLGEFFVSLIFIIAIGVETATKSRMDVGIWCGIWFVLTQAWGVTLGVLAERVTARWHSQAAEPVAPKPAADQTRPTPKQLNRKFASWVEYDTQSTHAVLFSSLGLWLSPHMSSGLIFSSMFVLWIPAVCQKIICLAFGLLGLGTLSTGLLLFHGRKFAARILFAFVCGCILLACVAQATVMLKRGASGYLIAPMFSSGVCLGVGWGFVCLFPRFHSFRIFTASFVLNWYVGALFSGLYFAKRYPGTCPDGKCSSETEARQAAFTFYCRMAAFQVSICLLFELKYRATLRRAHEMTRADASSYDEVWKTFVADESKLKALSGLADAYKAAMAGTEKRSKRQAAPSVGALFDEAYALQPLVVAKAEAISGDAGVAYGSTKTVARAFQKAWRSYGGNYRRLCDVVRVSIAFESVDELTACLERIVADDELELIPQGLEKCRFDPEYDPYAGQFVGYRDLQLGARFRSEATRKQGLDQHVVEIQLHLRVFEAIKRGHVTVGLPVHTTNLADWRMGSGHRTYVSCRNLRCS